LSIGEFDQVGTTVKEFADEDATVVVGTVIDPDMRDELRVTVVATGLGGSEPARQPRLADVAEPRMKQVRTVQIDEEALDEVAVPRELPGGLRATNSGDARAYVEAAENQQMDYLDIPAFLRRQAD
ncbi:MAG: cell division protein FtsZ, partial [Pseudomonadota bacterium]